MTQTVGFIGLGIMGKPMARNLIKAGYPLIVHNRSRAAVEELTKDGAQSAASSKQVAAQSEVIITMLPDSPDVELVYAGEQGIFTGAKPGALLIDMSSISPVVTRKLAEDAEKRRFRIRLHEKDMKIALAAGSEYGVPLMVTSQVAQMMTAMKSMGNGDLDHSGLVKLVEELAKKELTQTQL